MKNSNYKINIWAKSILLGIITLLFNLVDIKIPEIFFLFSILSAFPIVVIAMKYSEKISIIVSISILIILMFINPLTEALAKFFMFALPGVSIGYSIKSNLNLKESMIIGGFAYVIAFILSALTANLLLNINIINDFYTQNVLKFFEAFKIKSNTLNELFEKLSQINMNEYVDKILLFDTWWLMLFLYELFIFISLIGGTNLNILFVIIPGVITLTFLVISFIIIKITMLLFKKKDDDNNIEHFSEFRLSFGYGIVFIITQLILWGSNIQYGTISLWMSILLNLVLILNFGFMAQGVSIIDYYVKKRGIQGNGRIIIYIIFGTVLFFLLSVLLILALIVIGVLDYLFDFRKLQTR